MWVLRKLSASGVGSRRFVSLLAVASITAIFAILGPLSGQAFAESAEWNGDKLSYQGKEYAREKTNPLPPDDGRGRAGEVAYTWIETLSSGNKKAHTIFFENDSKLQAKDNAVLIAYDYREPNTYSSPSPPETLTISANLLGDEIDNEQGGSTCSGEVFLGLGWILCPVSMWLSEAVDGFYEIVRGYLEVPLATTDDQSGTYALWMVMRTIANVAFVIAFLVIIYSQLTSIGISNYSIKAMMPRLIIAALLVNISYFLCSIAIDMFNVLGHSVQSVMENIRENISITNVENLTWSNVTNLVLAGGGTGAAIAGFSLSFFGNPAALGLMAVVGILSVAFAIFVAFVILAARQALITVLVVISPLAFVAYLLPNTEQYFKKWLKSLGSLLLFFPLFSLLFGGSQLAGLTIIQRGIDAPNGGQLHIVLLGLVVQIVPLVITPLLIQFSTGLLGRIAGIANNTSKGPIDGLKNALTNRADYHKMKSAASDKSGWRNPFRRAGQAVYRSNRNMERSKKALEDKALVAANESKGGKKAFDLEKEVDQDKRRVDGGHDASWKRRLDIADNDYDRKTFQRELEINRIADGATISDNMFESTQSEMHAGFNPFDELGLKGGKDISQLVKDFDRNAEVIAATGTRKAYADRKQKQELAQKIAKNEVEIYGTKYQEFASGIQGESGLLAVKAQAEAENDRIMEEDIKNINSTYEYNFKSDPAATYGQFATSNTMSERIAIMMTFAQQGTAGDENIRKALIHMDQLHRTGDVSDHDLGSFKGITGSMVPNVRAQGEDVKRWLGNVKDKRTGNPRELIDLGNDLKNVWKKHTPASFAASAPIAQRQTLRLLAQESDEAYSNFINKLRDTELWGGIKDEVTEQIDKFDSGHEYLAGVPKDPLYR